MKYFRNMMGTILAIAVICSGCSATDSNEQKTSDSTEKSVKESAGESSSAAEQADVSEVGMEVEGPERLKLWYTDQILDEWSDDGMVSFCTALWTELFLDEQDQQRYPELSSKLDERNIEFATGGYSFTHFSVEEAKSAFADNPEFFAGYKNESEAFIQRADDRILSIREDGYEYTGGAHPMYSAAGYNYSPATGNSLLLSDVMTNTEELTDILAKKLVEKYPDLFEEDTLLQVLSEKAIEAYQWTMDYQGVTVYFNPYEISSYAEGILTIRLFFNESPDLFQKQYTAMPEGGYVVGLNTNMPLELDLDPTDAECDTIEIRSQIADAGIGVEQAALIVNGQEYIEDESYYFYMKPYLVCLEEEGTDRYFVYVETTAENDYRRLYVYALNGGEETTRLQCLEGSGIAGGWDEEAGELGTYRNTVFSDPTEVILATRVNILSTITGERTYYPNLPQAALEAGEEAYCLPESAEPLVSKIPLTVRILSDDTMEEIPAGSTYSFYQTDNESYMDMRLSDGRICRLNITMDSESYSWMVNGISEWECFEELYYAS